MKSRNRGAKGKSHNNKRENVTMAYSTMQSIPEKRPISQKTFERMLCYLPQEKSTLKDIIDGMIQPQPASVCVGNEEEINYFNTLDLARQNYILSELDKITQSVKNTPPQLMVLLERNIPFETKLCVFKKINTLKRTSSGSGEYVKLKTWVDTFLQIPFDTYVSLPINITNGRDVCAQFIESASDTLNQSIYGHNDAKLQILELIGQWVVNPNSIGNVLAIHGPPGTGKTSLVTRGISKILNRPFAFIPLGGASDGALLEGHNYTYEGSTCGRIVQTLIDSGCMNPIIYFDELDKVSSTPKGEEINAILAKITDPSQNSEFHDRYFTGIKFNLSRCLFVFSYNDETKINPILRDRLRKIYTCGYTPNEKIIIATKFIIPETVSVFQLGPTDIYWTPEIVRYIVDKYCSTEEGVREMKRCIEKICSLQNLAKLSPTNEQVKKLTICPSLGKELIDRLLKQPKPAATWSSLYC